MIFKVYHDYGYISDADCDMHQLKLFIQYSNFLLMTAKANVKGLLK